MQRHINTEGLINFRDLGGYPARNLEGQVCTVKPSMLYRSGHFNDLNAQAREQLARLGIGRVFDFRSEKERLKKPSLFPESHQYEIVELNLDPGSGSSFKKGLSEWRKDNQAYDDAAMEQVMCQINRSLVNDHADIYRVFFQHLLQIPPAPLVFHCASGKDRTGLAAALLLSALGVEREVILEDYLFTNACIDVEHQVARALEDFDEQYTASIDATALKAMYEVRPAYLQAAFDEIDRLGGMETFLDQHLQLREEDLKLLQNHYLKD
ncbi:MAG: tyrosine-protein phosphatase [Pseudomonadales bacterium]|nr:tyrosine-protein phosphatase [Pseudomonadales bacterium]